MAVWGTKSKSKERKPRSRAEGNSSSAAWQPAGQGRAAVGEEGIAKRAYEKWLARGGRHGDDQRDWFEAERELLSQFARSAN